MSFIYSTEHLDFSSIKTQKDLIVLLNDHDQDSFQFSLRTAILNDAISGEMGYSPEKRFLFFLCGMFHDTGKLGMSSEFLNYPGHYSIPMFREMQKHPEGGGVILSQLGFETEIVETARYHHANFDGSGYPCGLFKQEIPYHARLTRVSDSIDAFLSNRCYKQGGPVLDVVNDLVQYAETSYDPDILKAFKQVHQCILKECHMLGEDFPSQDFYTEILLATFSSDTYRRFNEEVLHQESPESLYAT